MINICLFISNTKKQNLIDHEEWKKKKPHFPVRLLGSSINTARTIKKASRGVSGVLNTKRLRLFSQVVNAVYRVE